MQIAGRNLGQVARSTLKAHHYVAALNMLRVYERPIDAVRRYVFGIGSYPDEIHLHTPTGDISLHVYSHDDILTINEIFCRLDYRADKRDNVIVDLGSNIGISAAYFLTRSPTAHAYLFEPLSFNIERLKENLKPFAGRYTLNESAVGVEEGDVEFGWEASGRYGGVGMRTGNYVTVGCVDSNKTLAQILAIHERINVLKIDIETLEREVTMRIPRAFAERIDRIYVEYRFDHNPLIETHRLIQYGGVAQLLNRKTLAPNL